MLSALTCLASNTLADGLQAPPLSYSTTSILLFKPMLLLLSSLDIFFLLCLIPLRRLGQQRRAVRRTVLQVESKMAELFGSSGLCTILPKGLVGVNGRGPPLRCRAAGWLGC